MPREAARRKAPQPQDGFPPLSPAGAVPSHDGHQDAAGLQKETDERNASLAREHPLKDKLKDAAAHLGTGLELLVEVLDSSDLPTFPAGDRHGGYQTSHAASELAEHAEQVVESLLCLARTGNREALGMVIQCGNHLAGLVEDLAAKSPGLLIHAARDHRSMPVRWHRKKSLNGNFPSLAEGVQLAEGLFEDPASVSRGDSGFLRYAREVLEEWASIERLGRKACARLQGKDEDGPCWERVSHDYVWTKVITTGEKWILTDETVTAIEGKEVVPGEKWIVTEDNSRRELVRGMVDAEYVLKGRILRQTTPTDVVKIWAVAFTLPPLKRGDMETARQWAKLVIFPYLKQHYGDVGIAKLEGFKEIARSGRKDDRHKFDGVFVDKLAQAVQAMVRPESKS